MKISQRLMEELEGLCARQHAFLGVADLSLAGSFDSDCGGEFVRSFPRAVSAGVRVNDSCVEILKHHENLPLLKAHNFHVYDVINKALDQLALEIARHLEAAGHRAFPVPASQTLVGEYQQMALFSHKMSAHLAGLGWIGKNCLLIHPQHGPRARYVTVLTDAPLPPGEPMESRCATCRSCETACPPKAILGNSFAPGQTRDDRLDIKLCVDYRSQREKTVGTTTCGLCLEVCPYGRKKKAQSQTA